MTKKQDEQEQQDNFLTIVAKAHQGDTEPLEQKIAEMKEQRDIFLQQVNSRLASLGGQIELLSELLSEANGETDT